MANDTLIDLEAIENLRALNPDDGDAFLRDIVGIFLEDTPLRITELHECLASRDQTRFTRAAHTIKGSSSNIGAAQLRAFAEKLEHHSKTEGLENVSEMISQLEASYAETKSELEKLVPPA